MKGGALDRRTGGVHRSDDTSAIMVCNRVFDLNPPVSGMVEPSVAGGDFRRHQPDPVLLMRIGCTLVLAQMGNGRIQNRMHATDMDGDKPHCAR